MPDGRIDRLIGDVARARTAGAPGRFLRGRVLARLGGQPRRRRVRAGWLAPATALAAVLVMAWVMRTPAGRPEIRVPSRSAAAPAPPGARANPRTLAAPPPPPASINEHARRPRTGRTPPAASMARLPPRAPSPAAPARSDIDPLPAPASLDLASIAVEPLAPARSLDISLLQTAAIEVAPLAPESPEDFPKEKP